MRRMLLAATCAAMLTAAAQATEPNAETRRWWSHIEALASDAMRGRDTGSPEHRKAAEYVVRQFERTGVRAAGEQGYFQPVSLHSYRLLPNQSIACIARGGRPIDLRWLQHIALTPALGLPGALTGGLIFAGSDNAANLDTPGAVVVRLNPVRLVPGPLQPEPPAGSAAVIGIDSAIGPEPARWPARAELLSRWHVLGRASLRSDRPDLGQRARRPARIRPRAVA